MSTWVLLRGLTRESRHWGAFPAILGQELPDADIVAPDLPGNGALHRLNSPTEVAAMADFCRARLLDQGIRPPYRLLALSLGAMVALAWAQRHPAEIGGCVLINTSLRPFSPFHRRLQPGAYPRLLRLLWPGTSAGEREAIVLGLTANHPRQAVLQDWTAYRLDRPVAAANAGRQLLAAIRFRAPAARPDIPLLVLASRRDALVDADCSRRIAARWQVPIAEHPSAGHDLPLDDGPWVARQVVQWLRAGAGQGH